jgi:hypothetical protein
MSNVLGFLMLPLHFLASLLLPVCLLQASLLLQAHSSCCSALSTVLGADGLPADAGNPALLVYSVPTVACYLFMLSFCIAQNSSVLKYFTFHWRTHLEISGSFFALLSKSLAR